MQPNTGDYRDVPDFIYGITREIWEDRGVGGKLERYYGPDVLVRAPTGLTVGNGGVTAQTLGTLQEFPDRQLVGQDVIWSAAADGSFLSSHRLVSVMRHQGDGSYGDATQRIVRSHIIADCWVVDTVVTEEWLVRDQAAFAHCLGIDPRQLARQMAERDLARAGKVEFFTPEIDRASRYRAERQSGAEVDRYVDGYHQLWQVKNLAEIGGLYFEGAGLFPPGGQARYGHLDIDRFYLGYLASFPDATLSIESAIVNRDPGRPVRVALRWSLRATHAGFGHFGPPSGASIYIMGLSHAEFVDGRIHREWMVVDEVSVWKQIVAHEMQTRR